MRAWLYSPAQLADEVEHLECEVDAGLPVLVGSHDCASRVVNRMLQGQVGSNPGPERKQRLLYTAVMLKCKSWERRGRQDAPCDV